MLRRSQPSGSSDREAEIARLSQKPQLTAAEDQRLTELFEARVAGEVAAEERQSRTPTPTAAPSRRDAEIAALAGRPSLSESEDYRLTELITGRAAEAGQLEE
jgi:hypothetical protein